MVPGHEAEGVELVEGDCIDDNGLLVAAGDNPFVFGVEREEVVVDEGFAGSHTTKNYANIRLRMKLIKYKLCPLFLCWACGAILNEFQSIL